MKNSTFYAYTGLWFVAWGLSYAAGKLAEKYWDEECTENAKNSAKYLQSELLIAKLFTTGRIKPEEMKEYRNEIKKIDDI